MKTIKNLTDDKITEMMSTIMDGKDINCDQLMCNNIRTVIAYVMNKHGVKIRVPSVRSPRLLNSAYQKKYAGYFDTEDECWYPESEVDDLWRTAELLTHMCSTGISVDDDDGVYAYRVAHLIADPFNVFVDGDGVIVEDNEVNTLDNNEIILHDVAVNENHRFAEYYTDRSVTTIQVAVKRWGENHKFTYKIPTARVTEAFETIITKTRELCSNLSEDNADHPFKMSDVVIVCNDNSKSTRLPTSKRDYDNVKIVTVRIDEMSHGEIFETYYINYRIIYINQRSVM